MPLFAKKSAPHTHQPSGGVLVTADGRTLPLTSAHLRATAEGGVARVTLEQTFRNAYAEPLHVTYQMPLPADGAVSGYAFRIGERRIVGEVDGRQKARERFEEAILDGRTAGLVDQERSSLFTQELGNVPPGATLVAELIIDQKLAWLPEGAWEWRFPTVIAPRYLGAEGAVKDAPKVTVDVADGPLPAGVSLALTVRDALVSRPESPSHPISVEEHGQLSEIRLASETARLDRDVVVRWAAAAREPGVNLQVARPAAGRPHGASAYGLLTVTPPSPRFEPEPQPRDLIVLLDTSGSMSGEPLDQARRVVSALVDSLTERDRLELIEFSSSPRRWKSKAVEGSVKHKRDALSWLAALRASGGTEMRTGILEALGPLREDAQRQVVVITDGLIGGEDQVLSAILERLPPGSRVHTVGVGSAVNRSLTQPAARAGRGVELLIGLGEDAERAAARIVARTRAPLLTGVTISGSAVEGVSPRRLPDVFAGAPLLASVRLRAEGGELLIQAEGAGGPFHQRVTVAKVPPATGSAAVCALYARETVEDLELALAGGASRAELDREIERLGITFQISTRLTSWIAVSEERTVDPTSPTRREDIPQELPYGMSAEGLGLRAPAHALGGMMPPGQAPLRSAAAMPMRPAPRTRGEGGPELSKKRKQEVSASLKDAAAPKGTAGAPPPPPAFSAPEPEQLEESMADEGAFGGGPADDAPAEKESRAKTGAGSIKAWAGRIVRRTDGELVLEIEVPADAPWPEAKTVRVQLDDGRVIEVAVDKAKTTRAGNVSAGMVVRLALTFPPGAFGTADPRELRVPFAWGTLVIAL